MTDLPEIPDPQIYLTTPVLIVHLPRDGARNRLVTTDGTRLVAKLAGIRKAKIAELQIESQSLHVPRSRVGLV